MDMDFSLVSANATPQSESEGHSMKILRPFNEPRNIYKPRTLLVIASENCLNVPEDLKTFTEGENGVHVRFATKLPLSSHDNHPPIDAVALVYKVFKKDSLKAIKDSIRYIDVRFLVGKCFILAISDVEHSLADMYEIETFASNYQLPIHYVSKVKNLDEKGDARLQIPSSLMSIYCPPIGSDVSSLIISAAMARSSRLLTDTPTAQ
ncbi:hypothetical protein BsWGS_21433 [Bradybaena similaris]